MTPGDREIHRQIRAAMKESEKPWTWREVGAGVLSLLPTILFAVVLAGFGFIIMVASQQ